MEWIVIGLVPVLIIAWKYLYTKSKPPLRHVMTDVRGSLADRLQLLAADAREENDHDEAQQLEYQAKWLRTRPTDIGGDDVPEELLPEEERRGHKDLLVPPRVSQAESTAAIKAEGLTMRFGDFTAVDHVSFEIQRGEIFGFLGSNGCGKTTTMKMLTGLLPATEGKASLFGQPAKAHDLATRKRVGFMTQAFSLYGELTVQQK